MFAEAVAKTHHDRRRQDLRDGLNEPVIYLCVIIGIHLLPGKSAYSEYIRFSLTVFYFTSVLGFIWWCLKPGPVFLQKLYHWRYRYAHPALHTNWQAYLSSLRVVSELIGWPLLVWVGLMALYVLSQWSWTDFLGVLSPLYGQVGWLSVITLVFYFFYVPPALFALAPSLFRLRRSCQALDFEPEPFSGIWRDTDIARDLQSNGGGNFVAANHAWSWKQLTENLIIFGAIGSGKTNCVLNALLEGILLSTRNEGHKTGGLILDPKGDFRGKIEQLCRKYGRSADLVVFRPFAADNAERWNPLDNRYDSADIGGILKLIADSQGTRLGDTTFFHDQAAEFFRMSVNFLRATSEPEDPPCLADVLELLDNPRQIARRAERLADDDPSADVPINFYVNTWFAQSEAHQTSIKANLRNLLSRFTEAPFTTALAGKSTFTVEQAVSEGKIIYLDVPLAQNESNGQMIGKLLKRSFQKEMRHHLDKPEKTFFLCDEFQRFFLPSAEMGDTEFFELSRQANHTNLIATQNLPALRRSSPRTEIVDGLLSSCLTQIFLKNGDDATNQHASEQFEKVYVEVAQVSSRSGRKSGHTVMTASRNEEVPLVPPGVFLGLETPNTEFGRDYSESIVSLKTRHESSGKPLRLYWPIHRI